LGCRIETFGGLEVDSAVHLNDWRTDLSGEIFPGTGDGADE